VLQLPTRKSSLPVASSHRSQFVFWHVTVTTPGQVPEGLYRLPETHYDREGLLSVDSRANEQFALPKVRGLHGCLEVSPSLE
jgi:hypothetical protein